MMTTLIGLFCSCLIAALAAAGPPNVVIILADDLGYGDVGALNPDSAIPTPNLDRLAAESMTFTDAHSPSGVCTPTRYGLLAGRYCWRSRLKSGVLFGYDDALIETGRPTIASVLRDAGYGTAAVGKWHLGMGLPRTDPDDKRAVDFAGVITDGPTARGFDTFFGVTASLDMPPYVYVENDRFFELPALEQEAMPFPDFIRAGPRGEHFVVQNVLDDMTTRAVGSIAQTAAREEPFFLYVALTAPHKPITPHPRFVGATAFGPYGDFVHQVDATVGRILDALDTAGVAGDSLVVFTSDNGSYMYRRDDADALDHVDDHSIQAYRADRHRANDPLRGTKADIWEGGHRVPFFVRWPGRVAPGSTCARTVCHVDIFATVADIIGLEIEDGVAEDSYSLLGMLSGGDVPRGAPVIHHSGSGMFAIRDGRWKLVLGNGSGGRAKPKGKPFEQPYMLFDLSTDLGERSDVAAEHPEVVERLVAAFETIRPDP